MYSNLDLVSPRLISADDGGCTDNVCNIDYILNFKQSLHLSSNFKYYFIFYVDVYYFTNFCTAINTYNKLTHIYNDESGLLSSSSKVVIAGSDDLVVFPTPEHRFTTIQILIENSIFRISLQRKWKSIRDCFSRELGKIKKLKSVSVMYRKNPYVYYSQLLFL